jgi:hypothetical protein
MTPAAGEHGLGYESVTLLVKADVMNLQGDKHLKKY